MGKSTKQAVVKLPRLHNHPMMERQLSVPPGHVIIDVDTFLTLKDIHGSGPINRALFDDRHRRQGINIGAWIDQGT